MTISFKTDKKARDAFEAYAAGKPTPNMVFINAKEGSKDATFTKIATPLAKISKNDYGHSLLVCFDTLTADELNSYDTMANRIIPNGFTFKKLLVEDDKLFLKLKVTDGIYECCDWIKPEDTHDFEGNVSITFRMGLWLNFESKTSGVYIKPTLLNKV